jgi:hypothetical protein
MTVASSFQVLFDGSPAEPAFYNLLTTLEVEENADLPGAIRFTLPITTEGAAGSEDLSIVGDDRFKPYASVAIVISIDDQADACIFDGYVLSHQVHLDKGVTASTVRVWGQDASCLMNLEEKTREWTDSDGRIANAIFGDPYGFATARENTDDDSGDHPDSGHTVMQRGTDAQFLRDRARRAGKLFRVCCTDRAGRNTGYFITPKVTGASFATLVLNPAEEANVDTLDIEWDIARPSEVKAQALIRARDAVDGNATGSGLSGLDARSLANLAGDRTMKVMLTTSVDDAGELRSRAQSVVREASWFVRCEGEADVARLNAVLRAATVVQINGAGRVHSGKYFVWSVRHTITMESHRMKFVLVRNALGAP